MRLDDIPDAVIDGIVEHAITIPAATTGLLSSCSRLRRATLRVLFDTLVIPDDARHALRVEDDAYIPLRRGPVSAFLDEPDTYGPYVRKIKISDPVVLYKELHPTNVLCFVSPGAVSSIEPTPPCTPIPLPAVTLEKWIRCMPHLKEVVWTSTSLPPDGLCESLVLYNKDLASFAYVPITPLIPSATEKSGTSALRSSPTRWDAPSLPHLSQLYHIRELSVSRLSQTGSKALSHLLRLCAANETSETHSHDHVGIHRLAVDVLWFDEELCHAISGLSKLQTLTIGTSGTKLRDNGMQLMLSNLHSLRQLTFQDVEGRISRSFWASVTSPVSLESLTVSISESGPHHSWAADHLSSLAAALLPNLQRIRIIRTFDPLKVHDARSSVDEVGRWPGTLIPQDVVHSLHGQVRRLECDWWLWTVDDLKSVLERCPNLEVIRIALDAPFTKIFGLITALSGLRNLRVIRLAIPASRLPQSPVPKDTSIWCPPSPVTPVIPYNLPTPTSSPVKQAAASVFRWSEPPTPPMENNSLASSGLINVPDPALPSLRDLKKLAKKCEKLERLEWYGHDARGSWIFEREPMLKITFQGPPGPSEDILARVGWEREILAAGWKSEHRDGNRWIPSPWLIEQLQKEEEDLQERQRELDREKLREAERAEREQKRRELERQKNEPGPLSSNSASALPPPAEDEHRSQYPLPAASRLSKQKADKTPNQTNGAHAAPSGSSKNRSTGSHNQGRRGNERGRSRGGVEGSKPDRRRADGSPEQPRRTTAGGGKGTWRGKGRGGDRANKAV